MATQEIIYNTLATTPSDHLSPDGQLALPLNLLYQDGALRPIPQPTEVMKLADGEQLLYIHEAGGKTNYIVHNPLIKAYISIDKDTKQRTRFATSDEGLTHFNAIGNTLIAFSKAVGMHYFLYKDDGYKSLGHQIPHIDLSFGLVGHPRLYSKHSEEKRTINIDFGGEIDPYQLFPEDRRANITEQVMAKVNKFIADETIHKGQFCYPFFVRYALRLYDGTLTAHSAPILMQPSTDAVPIVFGVLKATDSIISLRGLRPRRMETDIFMVTASLDYEALYQADEIKAITASWGDIVKSVEVFISKPIYTIDIEGKCEKIGLANSFLANSFVGAINATSKPREVEPAGVVAGQSYKNIYAEWRYDEVYQLHFSEDRSLPFATLELPELPREKVEEAMKNTASFFHVASIPLNELSVGNRKAIDIPKDYLQSLLAREVMTPEYHTNDGIVAGTSFVYNGRLNLADVSRRPFRGYNIKSMLAYINAVVVVKKGGHNLSDKALTIDPHRYNGFYQTNVDITEHGRSYTMSVTDNSTKSFAPFLNIKGAGYEGWGSSRVGQEWGRYLFYPNPSATHITIAHGGQQMKIPLTPHPILYGAYALLSNSSRYPTAETTPPRSENNTLIPLPNKIYTSDVNNPFVFPATGINTVGAGHILRLASATKALSQGQFGQFPLYAFTDEGVWALEVTEKGTYRTKQPITRDVCISPESITQIDNAVLFATERGIMLLSGSQTVCITESIDHDYPTQITSLPNADVLVTLYNQLHTEPVHTLTTKQMALLPLREYVTNCRMAYDYTHQRIFVYNPTQRYAYVYGLQDKAWGIIASNMAQGVNAYPEALVVDKAGAVLDLTKTNKSITPILLMTRPIKLSSHHEFKTIEAIIQRSNTSRDTLTQVLYGSNDLEHWHMVWSSDSVYMRGMRGAPYKYFIIAVMGTLPTKAYLLSASIDYRKKWGNKMR